MANITASQDFYYDIPFTGKLITSHSPFLIGHNDFSRLQNFVYTQTGIKTIKGMTQLASSNDYAICAFLSCEISGQEVIAYQTYLNDTYTGTPTHASWLYFVPSLPADFSNPSSYLSRRLIAYYYKPSTSYSEGDVALVSPRMSSPPDYFLYCKKGGTTGSSVPNFGSYNYNDIITDGTVKWIKYKGNLKGQLTVAPDNTIVFTNGFYNIIYGGAKHRIGAVINATSPDTTSNFVENPSFTTVPDTSWTWGSQWEHDTTNKRAKVSKPSGGGSIGTLSQDLAPNIVSGKYYKVTFSIVAKEGEDVYFQITPSLGGTTGTTRNWLGTYTETIQAGTTNSKIEFSASITADGDASVYIDDVSVRLEAPEPEYVDITDQVITELADDIHTAILKRDVSGNITLYVGSPLVLRGVNVHISSPNTNPNSSVGVARWNGSSWDNASSVTDGTNKFQTSGTITFAFSEESPEVAWVKDQPLYLYNRQLYWYRIILSPTSGTLPDTISVYHITCNTLPQQIPNLWSGETYPPSAVLKTQGENYTDHVMQVLQRDSALTWFSSSSYAPSAETTMRLDGVSDLYIGSIIRAMGFRITFASEYNGKTWTNNTGNTLKLYYFNGSEWEEALYLDDGTSKDGKSFNHDGVIYFTPPSPEDERKTTINTDTPFYYYRLHWDNPLGSDVYVDMIEIIPSMEKLSNYISCTSWNGRLVLAGRELLSTSANEVIISAPMSPYIWAGEQAITVNVGDSDPIKKVTSLFSRYGSDISETLILFKDTSFHYLYGTKQDDIKIFTVSRNIGAMSPEAIDVCDLGIRITEGVNRSVVLFAGPGGVYLFDNAAVITISDDISQAFIAPDYETLRHRVATFYDAKNSRFHVIFHDGTAYKEYMFDLTYKKWSEINRGNNPLLGGATLTVGGVQKLLGFTNNKIVELNSGTTMLGNQYTCKLTTGIKPFTNTLLYQANIRRVKMFAVFSGNNAGTAQISIKGYNDNDESISEQFMVALQNSNGIKSDLHHLNLMGNTFYFDISLSPTNNSEIELINLTVRGKIIAREG